MRTAAAFAAVALAFGAMPPISAASLLAASQAAAGGLTVTVPGDYATIQEAVDAVQTPATTSLPPPAG